MDPKIEFDTLKSLAKDGDPVDVLVVGGRVLHGEKRKCVDQYQPNDYSTLYEMRCSRPVSVTDASGMSQLNKQMALLVSLATQVNRKSQERDGIKKNIADEIDHEFTVNAQGGITEGKVVPGKEVASIRAQIASLRGATDAAVEASDQPEKAPEAAPEAAPAKTTRKKASKKAAPAADTGDMGMPVEEVL